MIRRFIDHRWFWIGMIAIALAATVLPSAWRAFHAHSNDFIHYWNAALALRNGEDIYTSGEHRYVYPPLLAFLLQPLTFIPSRVAVVVWIFLSGLLILVAVLIASRETVRRLQLDSSNCLAIAAVAMVLAFDKIRSLLSLGQSDALTLVGFACALRWMNRRPLIAGIAVGGSANVKYISLIFVPYFLVKRNYRAALSAILSFVGFLFLPAVQIGFQRAAEYAKAAFGGVANMFGAGVVEHGANVIDIAWNRSISIPSTIVRLTRGFGLSDTVAGLTIILLFLATIGALIWLGRSQGAPMFQRGKREESGRATVLPEWLILIVLALVFSPQTTLRHMVLMVLAFVVAVGVLLTLAERRAKVVVICAIGIMVAALTLPPYGMGMNQAVWTWRAIGGASWCALVFLFATVWNAKPVGRNSVETNGAVVAPLKDGSTESRPTG